MNQPIQKSYKDFNDNWPLNSWTVTEAGIYTNAAYVKMISKFASPLCLPTTISALNLSDEGKIIKSIFPSPSKNEVTVILNRLISGGKISLFDISGRIVFVRSIENENSMQIDLSGLTSGIYVLKVNSGETIEVARIVKQ